MRYAQNSFLKQVFEVKDALVLWSLFPFWFCRIRIILREEVIEEVIEEVLSFTQESSEARLKAEAESVVSSKAAASEAGEVYKEVIRERFHSPGYKN